MSIVGKGIQERLGKRTARRRSSILTRGILAWVDERTSFIDPISRFLSYPVPKYVHNNLLYSLGGLTLISLLLQIATGVLLSFYYDPGTEAAYDSVDYMTYQVPLGWLIRGLHYYNASALVILAVLHLLRTFFCSAYKKPREINWLSGVLLLLVILGFGFTGYLLPWDQRGYWATKVGTEIAGAAPVVGEWMAGLVRGGPALGQATLTRFYVVHIMLLPAVAVMLIGLHIHQLRYHGVAPPITKRGQALSREFVPFFPHWVMVDAVLGLGLLAILIYLSWSHRAPLEFPADPTSTDFLPRPEWYFLFLFQMLKYFPGPWEPVAAVLIPLLVIGSMLLLPFIDRSEERRPWRKPITTAIATFYITIIVLLTLLSLK
jgi:ubiquinol-cytochrome c reductase cytochrome b subunit